MGASGARPRLPPRAIRTSPQSSKEGRCHCDEADDLGDSSLGGRVDIKQGTEAVVEGFADAENRKLIINVLMTLQGEGAPREIVQEAFPRDLQLISEYLGKLKALLNQGDKPSEAASSGSQT